ncbi:PH domain-containing protein [Allonocardiopsis opalescens]|uniref:Putative membrane protein n=1 Tax=Allonocardiopsis opalescens TaxID=1144618 RepID=A0A2T0PXN5_9ACTN|nr:PH domain-containing protein [Allonocardiopsis opalescens]PRX96307.1 putative membrane protein [Allonocardiopsis opalescens]
MTAARPAAPKRAETNGARWLPLANAGTVGVTVVWVGGATAGGGAGLWYGLSFTALPTWALAALVIGGVVLITGAVSGFEALRCRATRYRVTGERLELRSGVLVRSHRSIARERVRSVDLTADLVSRVFGVTMVVVGTGQQGDASDELKLDSVPAAEAERLRALLLRRTAPGDGAADPAAPPPAETTLLRMDWGWLRLAPLTAWTVGLPAAAVGGVFRIASEFGGNPVEVLMGVGPVRAAFGWAVGSPWVGLPLVALVLLALGALATTVLAVEYSWGYRLTREPGGTLRARHGLLTTRSITLDERRLRGVELAEPLPLSWGGGAQLKAVATGLKRKTEDGNETERDALGPPLPVDRAQALAADVLELPVAPTASVPLRPHPRAALRYRRIWGIAGGILLGAVPAGAAALLGWVPGWLPAALAVLFAAAAVPLAGRAYRSLGHGMGERHLMTRSGAYTRRTVALRRDGVIGWTIRRSPLQRRLGLVTVTATTAAGKGAYRVRDAALGEGLAFADTAVPGLLAPFLADARPAGRAEGSG